MASDLLSRRDLGRLAVGATTGVLVGCFGFPPTAQSKEDATTRGVKNSFLKREVLFDRPSLGAVTDLRIDAKSGRLSIAGQKEGVRLAADTTVEASVAVAVRSTQVKFLDPQGGMQDGFLDTGGIGWQDAQLFDRNGRLLWTFGTFANPGEDAVNHTAVHDFNADGATDFVVGCNGGGGVVRLDQAGKVVWRQPDSNVWHVEIADTDGDGTAEIIHSNADGHITLRDAAGKILKRHKPSSYITQFSLCRWPDHDGDLRLLVPGDDRLQLLDIEGNELVTLPAPGSPQLGRAIGTGVVFDADGPVHLAVLTTDERSPTSLFVYDGDQKLVHQERLDDRGFALAARPEEARVESLLIGGLGKVWRYRPVR